MLCKNLNKSTIIHSVSTNFSLQLIEPSAREVLFIWTLIKREERGGGNKEIEHGRPVMVLETKKRSIDSVI